MGYFNDNVLIAWFVLLNLQTTGVGSNFRVLTSSFLSSYSLSPFFAFCFLKQSILFASIQPLFIKYDTLCSLFPVSQRSFQFEEYKIAFNGQSSLF